MQGFINFADDIGYCISVLVPLLCYLFGGAFLLASFWGFLQLARSGNRHEARPWVPFVTLTVAATLLSFDRMVNFTTKTFGGGVTASVTRLTSYTPPTVDGTTLLGASPGETFLNIIKTFNIFFESYGALVVLLSVMALKAANDGNGRTHPRACAIMMFFGMCVMNVQFIATNIMGYFGA